MEFGRLVYPATISIQSRKKIMEQFIPNSSQAIQAPSLGAGFGLRFGARVIDIIVHNIVWLGSTFTTGVIIGLYGLIIGVNSPTLLARMSTKPINCMFPLIGYVIYHSICEGMHGAALGKFIFKLHVLQEDGSSVSTGAGFIRSIAFYVDGLFFGIVAIASMQSSELKQRLGDKWAKTVVVQQTNTQPISMVSKMELYDSISNRNRS